MDASELKRENRLLRKRLAEANAQHEAVVTELVATIEEKDRKVSALEHRIKLLLKKIRGSRQERIDPDQLMLFSVDELQELADELEAKLAEQDDADQSDRETEASGGGKRSRGRQRLPKNLPREIRRHELDDVERRCPCCGELRCEIGVESSELLEFIPAQWKVIQHDRVKYACKACEENVATAPKPPQPIEKGLPAPGLCAHTVLSKFGDHTPLYRQEDIHARTGLKLRRSTLCGWLTALAELAEPLVMRMKHLVLQSAVIHTDDTKIKMLQPGMGIAKEAKFWPYLGDWLHPYAVYDFTIDRSRDGPQNFMQGFRGYLQADAYSGYDCIYAPGDVHEVACWVHARRYWHQVVDHDPLRANTALGYIARLSQIERTLRDTFPVENLQGKRDFGAIAEARQRYSVPILEEFKSWMDSELETGKILPKSELRKAFTYTQNQWAALCRYTEKGFLSMDNNAAERLVKNPSIGRKNFLFVGNERGGHNAAIHYSLVSSAKANGVEPFAWLADVFARLPHYRDGEAFAQSHSSDPVTSDELDELLPDQWLASHPENKWEIDEIRRKERERKDRRRRRNRLSRKRG